MSLDVSLIREFQVSYDKGLTYEYREEIVYESNITHNLNKMAAEAGLYEALWRPHRLKEGYDIPEGDHEAEYLFEINNPSIASDILPALKKGLLSLKNRQSFFKTFDSPNGWGSYGNFVPFVENYLKACELYPNSKISVSR